MCCCGDNEPTNTRFTVNNYLEVSYDGGQTWENGNNLDPRFTSTVQPMQPGTPGDEMRCNAAASVMTVIKDDIMQKLTETQLGVSLLYVIAAVIAIYLSAGALAPLVTALVGAAIGFGASAIEAAFTPSVWDDFQCIVYCHTENDGSITDQGWQLIRADVQLTFTGVAQVLLMNTVDAFGTVGLTNAARSGRATDSDCSDCGCSDTWCYEINFLTEDGDFVNASGSNYGNWSSGQGWVSELVPSNGAQSIWIKRGLLSNITRVEIDVIWTNTSGRNIQVSTQATALITDVGGAGLEHTFIWEGVTGATELILNPSGGAGNTTRTTRILVEGLGANPWGTDNCGE